MADQIIQRVFTGGEIAPSLRSRADIEKYVTGLALCENFIVRPQGGVYSRPGTRFIGELDDMTQRARLIPFSFNTSQTYMLVFEHLKMRVIKEGGYVIAGAGPALFELVTPYTAAQLSRLIFVQDADVMTITHQSHDPMALSRTADDNWALTTISYASTVTTPTGVAAVPVGTASAAPNKTYRYVVTAVDENGVESNPSAEVTSTQNALNVTYGVNITWSAVTGADFYRVYKDPSDGSGVYGWIGDSKALAFADYNISPVTSDSPPADFLPFAGASNKPACVGYYQQRQIFANTINEPQKVLCSQSAIYNSMRSSSPARDDDAIFFTVKARQVNEIRHIVAVDSLLLLTSSAEWRVTEGQDEVLTPGTVGVRPQSYWGASWAAPAVTGDSILFVQDKGTKIRDLTFDVSMGQYQGNDLSVMAEHLFQGYDITELTYALEPFGVLWCVRNDGVLLGMTYLREQGVWAWHQHVTDGTFESVASISEDGRDAVYVIVNRTIGGVTKRYVERMEPRTVSAPKDVFCVDSGLSYDSTPNDTFSGLGHLEGEAVAVVADGNEIEGLTVTAGAVTLPIEASKVSIGLPYIPAIETLDIDLNSMKQTLKGKEISISRVIIEVEKSRGGWVGPKLDNGTVSSMREIKPRFDSDGYDALALKSFKQEVHIDPLWSKSGGLRIEQRSPFPLAILSVIPDVDVS